MLTAAQIYDKIDRCCKSNTTTYPLAKKAVDVNIAQDEALCFALKAAGWNVDDFNQTKDPFITIDMVDGQRDYHFSYDEQSNLILGIYKVMVKDSSGVYHTLTPKDQQSQNDTDIDGFIDGQNTEGTPLYYDKTGNGIFLDPIPSYNSTAGLKVFIDREMVQFVAGDTTKISGLDGLVHDYLYLKPSYEYARDSGLSNTERLYRDMVEARQKIYERYGRRERDVKRRLVPSVQNNK